MTELILALDVRGRDRALRVAEEVRDYVDRIKVNYPLILTSGMDVIGDLSKIRPVIADLKIADVPHISSEIADIAFNAGAKAVIVHGFCGRETVSEVLRVSKSYGGEVYVVAELTSSSEFFGKVFEGIIRMAEEIGCDGVVVPGNRVDRVKRAREITDLKVICPGIGAQGGKVEEVVKVGVDGIIVGRAIYASSDPAASAMRIKSIINKIY